MALYDGKGNVIDISAIANEDISDIKSIMNYNIKKGSDEIIPKYEPLENDFGFLGRWYTKNINEKDYHVTNTSGSMIFFKIKNATTLSVDWYSLGEPYGCWAYQIDDGDIARKAFSDNVIELADTEEHIIMIVCDSVDNSGKWSNGNGLAFGGVITDGNVKGISPKVPKILFFGDSITEGIRTLGLDPDDLGSVNSVVHSYAWYTSKGMYALPIMCGYGSTGVLQTGSFNTLENMINYFYKDVEVDDSIQPDIIVINMGQNDSTYSSNTDLFMETYKKCVENLRIKYSGIPIACLIPFTQGYGAYIRTALENIPYVNVIETNGWNPATADGKHPIDAGSKTIASKLIPELQTILKKWK